MSSNVKKNFADFGQKCLILAILSIIIFILGIIAFSFPVVNWVYYPVILVYVIFLIIAIGDINSADKTLNNDRLQQFRSKIIVAVILSLIGLILFVVGINALLRTIEKAIESGEGGSAENIRLYVAFGIMILVGLILLIVGLVFEILAWGRLKTFFKENESMFSGTAGKNAQIGCLLMQLGAIPFIGPILRVVGFFLLYSLKKNE